MLQFAAIIVIALSALLSASVDKNLTCSDTSSACKGKDQLLLQRAHNHNRAVKLEANLNFSVAARCSPNSECVVPAGERWFLSASVDVSTLTVRGSLMWDTTLDGLELRACQIMVEDGGLFQLGTASAPMSLGARIYLKRCAKMSPVGVQFLAGRTNARIEIHGRPLERTMTLLAAPAESGSSRLILKHDPSQMGWRVGDEIGVATTHARRGDSSRHRITAMSASTLIVDPPLRIERMGGMRTIEGHSFEMAAEVVNMERSVLITGDHNGFHASGQGLTTMIMGKGSVGVVRYTRVEYCGQNGVAGRYCLHFHLAGHCPECVFQGNAVVDSFQSGITIHGTHNSLTDSNVLWQNRGVGIYIEDGNEMNNVISNNVIICELWNDAVRAGGPQGPTCIVKGANAGEGVGIYVVGMTNDLIGNHVVGHQHGLFTPGNLHHLGQGEAYGKVCPKHLPYGVFRGNVNHDCSYFGTYPDNQYPRNVGQRDEDGHVVDMDKCWQEVTADGRDNGVIPASKVEDGFDWHNDFVGQYTAGDIAYIRFTAVDCNTGMYWKRSKNFADPTAWHISDSVFADSTARIPGGPFTFSMKNVSIVGSVQLHSPQHCFSGPDTTGTFPGMTCNVQNLLENLDSTSVYPHLRQGSQVIQFGSSGGDPVKILWLARDNSLDGYGAIVSPFLDGFARVPGCKGPITKWGGGYGCDKATPIRRLNIFTGTNMGRIMIQGPGYEGVASNGADPVFGMNAGSLWWTSPWHDPAGQYTDRGSYAAPVVAGQHYTITGLEWRPDDKQPGDIVIEFSDRQTSQRLGSSDESVSLTLQTSRGAIDCVATANDDRSFFTPAQGPESGGALGDCGEKFRALAGQPSISVMERAHRRRWQPRSAAGGGASSGGASAPSAISACSDKSISDDNGAPHLEGVCLDMRLSAALHSADECTFCGEIIRTDGGLDECNDCVVRCWLQMSEECVGVVMEYTEGTRGSCTYFSRIDSLVHSRSGVAAIGMPDSFPAVGASGSEATPMLTLSPTPVQADQPPSPVATPAPIASSSPIPSIRPVIQVSGRQVLVNGQSIHLKAVNWNPVPKGKVTPFGLDFAGFVEKDAALMASAGINAVRTYEPITDVNVLDVLWRKNIWVCNTVYIWGGADTASAGAAVDAVKEHPAILMWVVGNEWNYNGLYNGDSFDVALAKVNEAVSIIKQSDPSRPVSTVYGELPSREILNRLSNVDVWGLNVYRGISFGDLFSTWRDVSDMPMYLGEYGADAYNALISAEDQDAQAEATNKLTHEIIAHSSVNGDGVCFGGFIFELADEWYKDQAGSPSVHDVGGVAPGGGPYPDSTFNEEWWGLLDIDRQPRKAFTTYAEIVVPSGVVTSPQPTAQPTTDMSTTSSPTKQPTPVELSTLPTASSPTEVPTSFPTASSAAEAPTSLPTASSPIEAPSPLPTTVATLEDSQFAPRPCGNDAWKADLVYAISLSFDGVKIRTDGGVRLCQDCAERCWRQMDNCKGVVFKPYHVGSEHGACTYYSSISRHHQQDGETTAVLKAEHVRVASISAPAPVSEPVASSAPSQFVSHPCGTGSAWETDLVVADGSRFRGESIRTDGNVHICRDCAVRCWLQMPGTCQGFVFEPGNERDVGSCTYFSSISGTRTTTGNERAITTALET